MPLALHLPGSQVTALQRCGSGEDEAAALLVKYRQQREDLDGVAFRDVGLEPQDATRLMRAAIQVGSRRLLSF